MEGKARLNIIDAIIQKNDTEDFYSGTNQEATVYRSVFCQTGLIRNGTDSNLGEIIEKLNTFVDSCSDNKMSFSNIIKKLTKAPYGMRLGVIPLLLAKVLSERGEDLVAYFANMEVPITPEIIVNMCEKPEEYSLFVSKRDHEKELYIHHLNDLFGVNDGRALTENRIKNIVLCMQRWFRALPQIARNNAGITEYGDNETLKKRMKSLKKMLQKVEVNPYEILFVNIPNEFGVDKLDVAYNALYECKQA